MRILGLPPSSRARRTCILAPRATRLRKAFSTLATASPRPPPRNGVCLPALASTAGAVAADEAALRRRGFPIGAVYFRRGGESSGNIPARVRPDALIKDECESIGDT